MDSTIEDFIIGAIKNPTLSMGIMILTIASSLLTKVVVSKLQWMYRRERFFKQLEMKFYHNK